MSWQAEELKEKGNAYFKKGEWASAETLYSQAIQKNSSNPLLYTNRANSRLKLESWRDAIDDCLRSIELMQENMKAYFYLAQAQISINHPNEALSSALMAYEMCSRSKQQTNNAQTISALVLRCKKAKWEIRERDRLRRRSVVLGDLMQKLEIDKKRDLDELDERVAKGGVGKIEASEERADIEKNASNRMGDLQTAFAISNPKELAIREVPDWLIDPITFEIMHDPVITKNGNSYERATIIEHLKRSATDPLTREILTINDLRPNIALRHACQEFMEQNSGWVYDW
ncbi:U-box-domain-containing protein [Pseudovirgaria hyperparasitica]|uniref:E3 ubiquitin-protein ligase CHIP n=1 Tax=Pseudovirgaria hyperparasitica TaxID=470096 RepID=A0A6A6WLT4_9PEZI|nr:U-box-domain-containing protein [Pseudovirgaria hyperparasitica]KAF2763122.1 U-box-domain-containing protein [Pseudovirgaria hyperparasitica]